MGSPESVGRRLPEPIKVDAQRDEERQGRQREQHHDRQGGGHDALSNSEAASL